MECYRYALEPAYKQVLRSPHPTCELSHHGNPKQGVCHRARMQQNEWYEIPLYVGRKQIHWFPHPRCKLYHHMSPRQHVCPPTKMQQKGLNWCALEMTQKYVF